MLSRLYSGLLTLIFISSLFAQAPLTESEPKILTKLKEIAVIDNMVMMPMSDGKRLSTDIYRPKTDQKVPVLFSRTPYNRNGWDAGKYRTRDYERAYEAVKRGYAYVVQNERGRYFSEGDWDILGVPLSDAQDAFTWMAKQSWSNGSIGTVGCSSTAEWQMAAAAEGHPALKAIRPAGYGAGVGTVGRFYEQGNWYRGGAQQMLFTSWLYDVQNDKIRPVISDDATQEDLQRFARAFDFDMEWPEVDWAKAFRHLPVQDIVKNAEGPIGIYEKMIRRKPNHDDWFKGGLYHQDMKLDKPGFWWVSWYDVSVGPNLELYNYVRENAPTKAVRDNQFLIIAPTLHCGFTRATENTMVGEMSMGDATLNYDEQEYAFWDYWLKGNTANADYEKIPRVQYFMMGKNEWKQSDTWPPKKAKMTTYYLTSEGSANTLYGDGGLSASEAKTGPSDTFVYDPDNPVPTWGGNHCCMGNSAKSGVYDQRPIEARQDVLVYTSEPLEKGIEVSGFIESTLYVSSDARDTDITIKLVDVYPDGTAYNLDETIQRLRYREGYEKEVWMKEGEVVQVDMSPMSTSNYFEKGHRIRIEISSSNFPRFTRNLNTGGVNWEETTWEIATNTIHHTEEFPSQIRIPIVGN